MSILLSLLPADVFALFGHGALHEQDERNEEHRHDGTEPEDVEVGQRSGLLLAEIVKRLPGHPLRPGRVAGMLVEEGAGPFQEGSHVRVKGVEEFANARQVELLAAFLNGVFGLCLGCEIYLLIRRIWPGRQALAPAEADKEVPV